MRPITWLQISDIHMRLRDEWSQDVILRAMSESIERMRGRDGSPDFVLATGDLAFSGRPDEYELVKRFLDAISVSAGVSKEHIFCVPGNHDVNRDRQKLCFRGARDALTSANIVDPLLAPDDNLATLAQRQQAYREFQNSYLAGQARTVTADGLAYVSSLTIDDVVVAIVGLNSAWLAEGGEEDHGRLLVGERQVINAFNAVVACNPHIVIAMAHHPLHLLREFDRNAVTNHVNTRCQFFHCGHLHQPEARGAGFSPSGCLTVAAGASFETRESHNTYSIVKLNLAEGTRKLTIVQYDKGVGAFAYVKTEDFPIELTPAANCSVVELAEAIAKFDSALDRYAYYFAALLLDSKSDVPMASQGTYVFGTAAVLRCQPEDELCRKTIEFLRFKNALTVFSGRMPIDALLERKGEAIKTYGQELIARCESDHALAARLDRQDADVRALVAAQPRISFAMDLFADLVSSQDWDLLREQASRHLSSSDSALKILARRMLALALAHGTDAPSKDAAILQFESLIQENVANVQDRGNLATVFLNLGRHDDAKAVIFEAVGTCPLENLGYFEAIGQKLVEQTGDRDFRKRLKAVIAERGSHD